MDEEAGLEMKEVEGETVWRWKGRQCLVLWCPPQRGWCALHRSQPHNLSGVM